MPDGREREDVSETENQTAGDSGRYSGEEGGDTPTGIPGIDGIMLRDKTFTKELRQLVEKVTSHETLESLDDNLEHLTEEELIHRYHSLFYHAIHLPGLDEINSNYNPYTSAHELEAENLITSISGHMTNLLYPAYAILSYHIEKRCFIPVISTISDLDMVNLFIDVGDPIYKKIKASPQGIIITPEIMENDPFLKKRFTSKSVANPDAYFCNSIKNLTASLFFEGAPDGEHKMEDAFFSPVMLVRIRDKADSLNPSSISRSISRELSVQLLMYEYSEMKGLRCDTKAGIIHAFNALEYLFRVFMQYVNGRCFVLTCGDDFSAERRFAVSYFLSKLHATVSNNTMIAQIENHRIILFTTDKDSALIDSLISAWNRIFVNIFEIRIYDNRNKLNYLDFLKDYVF